MSGSLLSCIPFIGAVLLSWHLAGRAWTDGDTAWFILFCCTGIGGLVGIYAALYWT